MSPTRGVEHRMSGTLHGGPIVAGASFGGYRIIKRLAVGGMAELFLGHRHDSDQVVVIKKILPQFHAYGEFVDMFLDEARIASTLSHDNIVAIHDVGSEGNSYFFTMEYVLGHDLRTFFSAARRAGQMPPLAVTIQILTTLGYALDYAHEKRDADGKSLELIHRDVSPDNVFISYDGVVKLGDFGIAKAANRLNQTRTGQIKGKVTYMSPEQSIGKSLDRRSDVFSLGVMVWEMTTGHRLFDGESDFHILKKIVEDEIPSPRRVDPEYPPALEAIVMRALAKDRDQRYPTAKHVADALLQFAQSSNYVPSVERTKAYVQWVYRDELARLSAVTARHRSKVDVIEEFVSMVDNWEPDGLAPLPDLSQQREQEREQAFEALKNKQKSPHAPHPVAAPFEPIFSDADIEPPQREPVTSARALAKPKSAWLLLTAGAVGVALLGAIGWGATSSRRNDETTASAPPSVASPAPPVVMALPVEKTEPAPIVVAPIAAAPSKLANANPKKPAPSVAARSAKTGPAVALAPARSVAAAKLEAGRLVLDAKPWVDVSVDGKPRGQTPLAIELPAGPHRLSLVNRERAIQRTLDVVIEPKTTLKKKLDFE